MNHSSRNHHRQTTRLVTGAGHYQHGIEAQTGWGIEKFVRTTRCYRIVKIKADNQTRNSAGPLPDDLRHALIKISTDVRTNLSQVGCDCGFRPGSNFHSDTPDELIAIAQKQASEAGDRLVAGAAELVLREPFDKSQAAQAHSQLAAHRCAPAVAWLPTGIAARVVHAGSTYVVQFGSGKPARLRDDHYHIV